MRGRQRVGWTAWSDENVRAGSRELDDARGTRVRHQRATGSGGIRLAVHHTRVNTVSRQTCDQRVIGAFELDDATRREGVPLRDSEQVGLFGGESDDDQVWRLRSRHWFGVGGTGVGTTGLDRC